MKYKFLVCFSVFAFLGCPKPQPQPPPVTNSDAQTVADVEAADSSVETDPSVETDVLDGAKRDECGLACASLRVIGCKEGSEEGSTNGPEGCTMVCRHIKNTNIIKFDAKCISLAKTEIEVRKCAGVKCKK